MTLTNQAPAGDFPPPCQHTAARCGCHQITQLGLAHQHHFMFLRTYEDRGTYQIERGDVFFCESCLEYRRVPA